MGKLIDRGDEYTCCICGRTYTATLSTEEALANYKEHFGDEKMSEEIVCNDCFETISAVKPTPGMKGEL